MTPIQILMLGVGASKKTYLDDVFSTFLYKGNNGANTVNVGIDFASKGGMSWVKGRNSNSVQNVFDTDRGANKRIRTNGDEAENTGSYGHSFTSTGFTWNTTSTDLNDTNVNYASWNFRKAPGFFDIVTYTGNGSNRTIAHSLGCVPGMIMIKNVSSSVNWRVYHRSIGAEKNLILNFNNAAATSSTRFNDTEPTASVFSVGTNDGVNENGDTYVAYLFAGGESSAATARSVDFDGTGDYLEIADHADFDLGNGNFTVECWVKGTADGGNRNIVGQWSSGNKSWSVFWGASNQGHSAWGFKYSTDNSNETQVSDILLDDDQWHHIAVVRDGNDLKLYRDGILRKKHDISSVTLYNSADPCRIANDGWDAPLDCHISNLRLVKGSVVYTTSFRVPTEPLTNITNTKLLCCNGTSTTSSTVTPGTITANGDPTSSTVTPFDDPAAFKFGDAGDQNVIKCGSYVGNGSTTSPPEINLGFEPQFLLFKDASSSSDWQMYDSMRQMTGDDANGNLIIKPNTTSAEGSYAKFPLTTSTGFKVGSEQYAPINGDGNTVIYLAIRRPDGYVGKPADAGTDVFTMDTGASQLPVFDSGFPVDFALAKKTTDSESWWPGARLINGKYLSTDNANAEGGNSDWIFDYNDGWNSATSNYTNSYYQSWMWKRHAGFDVVTYTGNGTSGHQISHSLSKSPEMVWVKKRNDTSNWTVYHKGLNGGTTPEQYYVHLDESTAENTGSDKWNNTAPTSTYLTIGNSNSVNENTHTFIALLFASVDGISKVGYYDGSSSTVTITTGFQPRFVIIKRATGVGQWSVFDTTRGWAAGNDQLLELSDSAAQANNYDAGAPTSTGFTVTSGQSAINNNGDKYIYYAHA